jgi:hypothetical protein
MSDLIELHRDVGKLDGQMKALTVQVDRLAEQVTALNAVLNQGKGARMILLILPAMIGLMTGALGYFGIKFSVGH